MKAVIWIIILALIGWGIYALLHKNTSTPNLTSNPEIATTSTPLMEDGTITPKTVTVSYTNQGFSPQSVTINQGDTVKFVNDSSGKMWVASASHPSHTAYDGTNLQAHCATGAQASFDECQAVSNGNSYSFQFNKTGTWNYHNHSAATNFGTVIVQ